MNDVTLPLLQRLIFPPARLAAILVGLAVPVSVAADNFLLALVLLGGLAGWKSVVQMGCHHPVARAGWLLFGALLLATSYGATPGQEALGILGKYADLAFIPIFMRLLAGERARRWAQYAFLGAMGITLLLSWSVGLHGLQPARWMYAGAADDLGSIFHSHITQNNMMAFAVFLALLNCRAAGRGWQRWAWGGFALLGIGDILFVVQGRTGYLILLVLLAWFGWTTLTRYLRQRGMAWNGQRTAATLLLFLLAAGAIYQFSPRVHERVGAVISEFQRWQPNQGGDTSTGQRLDFYLNTLQIVQQHPWLGVGTGGFPAAFAEQAAKTGALPTHNPHNEFLMISVQTGALGLICLLYLFACQWRGATGLASAWEQDAARGLVLAYVINGMLNSALLDHADGLFFAWMTAILFAGLKPPALTLSAR